MIADNTKRHAFNFIDTSGLDGIEIHRQRGARLRRRVRECQIRLNS